MKKVSVFLFITSVILLAGCVPPPPVPLGPTDQTNPLRRVAVLPMKNDTADVDGPKLVREKMEHALIRRSYVVKDGKETDQILRDQMGITLGGQLDLTTPQKLGEALGVEGVLYGTLMDFDETTTGVYNVRKVRAKFKLVNTVTGQTEWERGLGVRGEMSMEGQKGGIASVLGRVADGRDKDAPWVTIAHVQAGKNYKESLAIGLGTRLLTKALGIHLEHESSELARRVTDNLRWGPGAGPVIAAVKRPRAPAPEMSMPSPPTFGYLDYGKRDFSALIVSRSVDKTGKDVSSFEIPFAKAGERVRMDMDLAPMAQGGAMPPGISKMTALQWGDRKEGYTLYPNVKKYLVHRETEKGYYGERPKVEKTRVGSEVVGGHLTDKYRVKITYKDGATEEGFIWNARDLDGMTIRSEVSNKDVTATTELKNIVLKTPDASLFEIPKDYTEAKDLFELMVDKQ
jgi:hypothetical protein